MTSDPRRGGIADYFGSRSERKWLAAIVAAYLILSSLYALFTPIGEGPDELDHIRYVEYLTRFGQFAPISAEGSTMPYTLEAKQPPGYYLLNAGIMLLLGREGKELAPDLPKNPDFKKGPMDVTWYLHPPVPGDLLPWTYIMRFLGILMGVGVILLTFATVREVFPLPDHVPLALCAAAISALLPQATFISSVVNNDNVAKLVGAALAYWVVRMLARGVGFADSAVLGVLLGLALLSKMHNLLYIPVALLVLIVAPLKHSPTEHRAPSTEHTAPIPGTRYSVLNTTLWSGRKLALVSLAVLIALGMGGWWYARNLLVYGDLLAMQAVNEMAVAAIPTHIGSANLSTAGALLDQLFIVLSTHFGAFGWVVIKPPPAFYLIYMTLLAFAAIGLVVEVVRRRLGWTQIAQVTVALLTLDLFYAGMIYNVIVQGRILYPALAFSSMLSAVGTYGLFNLLLRRNSARANAIASAVVWATFLGIANVYCLFGLVIPSYQ